MQENMYYEPVFNSMLDFDEWCNCYTVFENGVINNFTNCNYFDYARRLIQTKPIIYNTNEIDEYNQKVTKLLSFMILYQKKVAKYNYLIEEYNNIFNSSYPNVKQRIK